MENTREVGSPHLAGRPATESPSGPEAPHSACAPGPTFPAEQPRQRGPAPRLTQGGGEQPSAGASAPRHGPEGSRGHGRQQRCSDVPPNDSRGPPAWAVAVVKPSLCQGPSSAVCTARETQAVFNSLLDDSAALNWSVWLKRIREEDGHPGPALPCSRSQGARAASLPSILS